MNTNDNTPTTNHDLPAADQNLSLVDQEPAPPHDLPLADPWDQFQTNNSRRSSSPAGKGARKFRTLEEQLKAISTEPQKPYRTGKPTLVEVLGADLKAAFDVASSAVADTTNMKDAQAVVYFGPSRMIIEVSRDGDTSVAEISLQMMRNLPDTGIGISIPYDVLESVIESVVKASDAELVTINLTPQGNACRVAVGINNYRRNLGSLPTWTKHAAAPATPLATEQIDRAALRAALGIACECKPRTLYQNIFGVIEFGDRKVWCGDPNLAVILSGDLLPTSDFVLTVPQALKLSTFLDRHGRGSLQFIKTATSLVFASAVSSCTLKRTTRRFPQPALQLPAPDPNALRTAGDQLALSLPLFRIISPWERHQRNRQLPIRIQYEASRPGVLTLSARQPCGTNYAERQIRVSGSITSDWDFQVRWADFLLVSGFFRNPGDAIFDLPSPHVLRLTQHDNGLSAQAFFALS